LKGDIVEALQFVKRLIRRDLLFRIPETLVDDKNNRSRLRGEGGSWDIFVDDDPENYDLATILLLDS
jgi:hypothetical protein